jgi:hypothetical protein
MYRFKDRVISLVESSIVLILNKRTVARHTRLGEADEILSYLYITIGISHMHKPSHSESYVIYHIDTMVMVSFTRIVSET